MIRKLKSGQYRLYSRKADPKTGKRRNPGTFDTREAVKRHEREVQYLRLKCRRRLPGFLEAHARSFRPSAPAWRAQWAQQ